MGDAGELLILAATLAGVFAFGCITGAWFTFQIMVWSLDRDR